MRLWRDIRPASAAERLDLIAGSYGSSTGLDILRAVPSRIQLMLDWIPAAAAAGDQGLINLMAAGEPERSRRSLRDLQQRIAHIAAQLNHHPAQQS